MSGPFDRRARMLAALYDKFGEPASWTPAAGGGDALTVTVRHKGDDAVVAFGTSEAIAPQNFMRVRSSEVAAPVAFDQVQKLDAAGQPVAGQAYQVMGAPRLVHSGLEWLCEVREV